LQVPQKVVAVRRNEAQANVRCFGQAPVARRALGRLGGIDQGVALGDFFAYLGAGEKRLARLCSLMVPQGISSMKEMSS
jgi:hypothetical protein